MTDPRGPLVWCITFVVQLVLGLVLGLGFRPMFLVLGPGLGFDFRLGVGFTLDCRLYLDLGIVFGVCR